MARNKQKKKKKRRRFLCWAQGCQQQLKSDSSKKDVDYAHKLITDRTILSGKRSAVRALLFQPAFQSQARARSVQTSVHKRAGGPCAHCWTSVTCQVSTALLAPLRGASFHPLEKKLGQVLLQGAALKPRLRDFSGVQQILRAELQVPQVWLFVTGVSTGAVLVGG